MSRRVDDVIIGGEWTCAAVRPQIPDRGNLDVTEPRHLAQQEYIAIQSVESIERFAETAVDELMRSGRASVLELDGRQRVEADRM